MAAAAAAVAAATAGLALHCVLAAPAPRARPPPPRHCAFMPDSIGSISDEGRGVEVEMAFLSEGHLFRTVMYGLSKQLLTEGEVERS